MNEWLLFEEKEPFWRTPNKTALSFILVRFMFECIKRGQSVLAAPWKSVPLSQFGPEILKWIAFDDIRSQSLFACSKSNGVLVGQRIFKTCFWSYSIYYSRVGITYFHIFRRTFRLLFSCLFTLLLVFLVYLLNALHEQCQLCLLILEDWLLVTFARTHLDNLILGQDRLSDLFNVHFSQATA